MRFEYKKEANIKGGQKLFGIIAVSCCTYDGIYPITVYDIDYNNEEVIFEVDQPCEYVSCSFSEMEYLVFESEEEAKTMKSKLKFEDGLYAYNEYPW